MKSSSDALRPSRCAAMAISAPTVTTPVPPTPVTRMSYGASSSRTGGTGSASPVAQLALDRSEVARMVERCFRWELRVMRGVLSRLVADYRQPRDAFRLDLAGDPRHRDRAVDGLPAGHRDRVVIQDLVGDIRVRRDRLPDRHQPRMDIVAVADALEQRRALRDHRPHCL